MIGWLLRATFATIVMGLLGYFVVSVPIGRRTLFEHGLEISRTPPAQQLADDVGEAATSAYQRVKVALDER
jgi:hypothetical protein